MARLLEPDAASGCIARADCYRIRQVNRQSASRP
jgi:hypothetical protein